MGLTTTAPLILPTRRTLVFTSSTTWTVPSSALYVDVMVVGGGAGGYGAGRAVGGVSGVGGGGVTIVRDIYLGGTGTVSIVVGAGGNGATGTSLDNNFPPGGAGTYSGFGTYVYSQGANPSSNGGNPGYKGTTSGPYNGGDTTYSNYAPYMFNPLSYISGAQGSVVSGGGITSNNSATVPVITFADNGSVFGISGGKGGSANATGGYGGMAPNGAVIAATSYQSVGNNTLPWNAGSLITFGTAIAGTAGASGGAGGAAGVSGFSGGGGGNGGASGIAGGPGGPGAGGTGGQGNSGTTGGNGGAAGANTGSAGGNGGATGVTGSGTGGNGGNGGSGFVIVSYIGTN